MDLDIDAKFKVAIPDDQLVEIVVSDLKESYATLLHFGMVGSTDVDDDKVLLALNTVLDYYLTREEWEEWLNEIEEVLKKAKNEELENGNESVTTECTIDTRTTEKTGNI